MADNVVGAAYVAILPGGLAEFGARTKAGVASAMGEVSKASSAAFGGVATEAERAGGRIGSALKKGGGEGVGAIKSLQGALNEAGVATSPLLNSALSLSSRFGDLQKIFPGIGSSAAAGLGAVGTEAKAAGGAVSAMGAEGAAAATGLTGGMVVLLVAIAAVVAMAAKGLSSYLSLTASVRAFQRVSGASAEDASKMVAAAEALGMSSDTLARGIFRMNNVAETSPQKFKDLGIEIARTKNGAIDSVATFNNVADAVRAAGKGADASRIAMTLFGRSGLELLPILLRGSAGLNDFYAAAQRRGDVFSQKDLNDAAAFSIKMRELGTDAAAVTRQFAQALLPVLSSLLGVIGSVVSVVAFLAHILGDVLSNQITRVATEVIGLGLAFGPFGVVVGAVIGIIDIWTQSSRQAASAAKAAASAVAEVAKQRLDLRGAVVGLIQAQQAEANATAGVRNANASLGDAQKALSVLKRQGAVDSKAVTSALRSEESAAHGVEVATRTLTAAQAALAKLAAGPDVKTLATDMRALDKATDSVAKSTDRVAEAKKALDIVLRGPTARDVADASNAVTKAQQQEERATYALADARTHLKLIQDASSPAAHAAAQAAVMKTTLDLAVLQTSSTSTAGQLAAAQTALVVAQAQLSNLQALGTPTAQDLAVANLDVRSASLSLTDATTGVSDAQTNLTTVQNRGKQGSADLKAAQSALAAEEENLTNAIDAQTQAQTTINELRAASLPGSEQYRAAQQAVADAVYGVAQAHQAANDAAAALRTAQAGDPAFADKITAAERAVQSAQQGVADAKISDLVATLGLTDAGTKLAEALGTDMGVIDQLKRDFQEIARQKPELAGLLDKIIEALGGTGSSAATRDLSSASMEQKLAAIGYTPQQIADTMKAVAAGVPRHDILQHWRDLGHGPTGAPLPPGFAGGGWIGGGSFGEPVIIMAHVGERVQTAAQARGGDGVSFGDIHINLNGPIDERVLPQINQAGDTLVRKLTLALRVRR